MNQIEIHNKIDELVEKNPDMIKSQEVSALVYENNDSRQYFFAKANESWLDWLWEKGFLDAIMQKSEDLTKYYRTPELNYLSRMAEKKPKEVVDIMLLVPISKDNFNREVIDQFLNISSSLPAEELIRIVPKIRNDDWVKLMSVFSSWGFDYEKMFQVLANAKEEESILVLAEAVLIVKTKDELEQSYRGSLNNPFYFNDVSNTKVFEHLIAIGNNNLEKSLELATRAMSKIVCLGEKTENNSVFPLQEMFYLFDIDFFSLELNKEERHSDRENVKELAATIKILIQRLIGECCNDSELVKEVYKKYIQVLPESRSMWRLKLFILSLCPKAFQLELKQSLSKLFEVMKDGKHYYEIESGTEYKKTLNKSFSVFDDDYQREYILNVFDYFGKSFEDEEKAKWYKRDGWQILSSICEFLTEKERENCEKIFGKKCDSTFEPEPSIGKIHSGFIKPRAAISQEEFSKLSIVEIIKKLKSGWSPEALQEQRTSDDFFNPLNAEGVGEQLRTDIAKRLQDYIQNSNLFFERNVLNEHYTYSFFRGIQEAIHGDKSKVVNIQWDKLIEVFINIKKSGITEVFDYEVREQKKFNAWLSSWTGVHSAMTDVLQELLNENNGKIIIDFMKYRNQLFEVISYLLAHPEPKPKDEELETAIIKKKLPDSNDYLVSDPYSIAINTVRGRAFQVFVLFVYQDGKQFSKDEKIKIAADAKNLYQEVLEKENTRALMFMFGHYLPSFYFRDKDWVDELLPQIFPEDRAKQHLYLTAWEGYITTNLYEEMFFDRAFQRLYGRGLTLAGNEDPNRKYFKEPDEGIAVHMALAFVAYYKKFGFKHPLFVEFWKQNIERQAEFVNFIGRAVISGDNTRLNDFIKKQPKAKKRLEEFWEWLLKSHDDPRLFVEFGFWINIDKKIFEPLWLAKQLKATLEKTNGSLEWDYALAKSINELAKVSPREALDIVRLYLLEGGVRVGKIRMPFTYDEEWFEAIKTLYDNLETRADAYTLIDNLIREGGSTFWKLKEVIG
jgi:hypothetical protein